MKISRLRQLIHEEVRNTLNEGLFLTQTGTDSSELKAVKQKIHNYIKDSKNLKVIDGLILDICQLYADETK